MKALGLNQSALAQRMKVSRPYISKVMRSDVNISFATAAKLARALQMDFFPELRERKDTSLHESSCPPVFCTLYGDGPTRERVALGRALRV